VRYVEDKIRVVILVLLILALLTWLFVFSSFGQVPGPTPNPADYSSVQEELGANWAWAIRHPNCVMRPSKTYRNIGRDFEEKLKVVGAPVGRPAWNSMIRSRTFRPFVRDGKLVGGWADDWTYQTSSSTSIGVGPPSAEDIEVPE